jgi:hypothetical protein
MSTIGNGSGIGGNFLRGARQITGWSEKVKQSN